MRIYQILLFVLSPFILFRIFRLCCHKNYRLLQAFGFQKRLLQVDLWIHCASVGEVISIAPFVEKWHQQCPDKKLLITTMTPTGAAQVKRTLMTQYVEHRYLPIDWAGSVKRFLNKLECPRLLIVETELWPNLLQKAKAKGIEIHVINARMSEESFRKYSKAPTFTRSLMQIPDQFCAHHQEDADRFSRLGAQFVTSTGNIKFDMKVDDVVFAANWRSQLSENDFVWTAASTHENEDERLLLEHKKLKELHPTSLMIIVPRHPERFEAVYKLARQHFKKVGRRSNTPMEEWHTFDVLLGDSMGEMMYYYQASDVVFVAGSLIEHGGHNPIEPALLAKPVLVGKYTFNFKEITEGIIQAGGGIRCKHTEVIGKLLISYAENKHFIDDTGRAAQDFVKQNQGAVDRVLKQVTTFSAS